LEWRRGGAHFSACLLVGELPGKPIGRVAPRAWLRYFRNSSVRLRVAPMVVPPLLITACTLAAHPG